SHHSSSVIQVPEGRNTLHFTSIRRQPLDFSVCRMCRFGVVLLLMVVTIQGPANCFDLDDGIFILKLGREIVLKIGALWSGSDGDGGVVPAFMKESEQEILKQIGDVSRQLSRIQEQQRLTAASIVNTLLRELPQVIRFELKMDRLVESVRIIDGLDKQFKRYIQYGYDNGTSKWSIEQHTLENFASYVVSHDPNSIQGTLERIHTLIVPEIYLHKGIFEMLAKQTVSTTYSSTNTFNFPSVNSSYA
ncbi:hypothetical protein C0J52_13019, partial [Blattella germanica]